MSALLFRSGRDSQPKGLVEQTDTGSSNLTQTPDSLACNCDVILNTEVQISRTSGKGFYSKEGFIQGGLWRVRGAHKVQAMVCPFVSDPAMKKISNSSISRSVVSGRPRASRSRSRCPAIDPASSLEGGLFWQSFTNASITARTRRWFASAASLS